MKLSVCLALIGGVEVSHLTKPDSQQLKYTCTVSVEPPNDFQNLGTALCGSVEKYGSAESLAAL